MDIISKSAQTILEKELSSYKNKLIERASAYAEHDGDLFIGDKHLELAIRDSEKKELGSVRYEEKRQKNKIRTIITWLLLLLSLIGFTISIIYLGKEAYEQVVLVVCSIVSGLSIASVLMLIAPTSRKGEKNRSEIVVAFLDGWNEFESLLTYSYKGTHKGGNIPLTDLIQYYLQNISDNKDIDNRRIVNLLKMRNSLVHRGINRFDEKILVRHTLELQDLIKRLKSK